MTKRRFVGGAFGVEPKTPPRIPALGLPDRWGLSRLRTDSRALWPWRLRDRTWRRASGAAVEIAV